MLFAPDFMAISITVCSFERSFKNTKRIQSIPWNFRTKSLLAQKCLERIHIRNVQDEPALISGL
jgi:hypothetical protein